MVVLCIYAISFCAFAFMVQIDGYIETNAIGNDTEAVWAFDRDTLFGNYSLVEQRGRLMEWMLYCLYYPLVKVWTLFGYHHIYDYDLSRMGG